MVFELKLAQCIIFARFAQAMLLQIRLPRIQRRLSTITSGNLQAEGALLEIATAPAVALCLDRANAQKQCTPWLHEVCVRQFLMSTS